MSGISRSSEKPNAKGPEVSDLARREADKESPHWEHFSHGADIGLRGFGNTIDEAFEAIAVAATAVLTQPEGVKTETEVAIEVTGPDPELLLVNWLNAIIYEMATRAMIFGRFRVHIDGWHLKGEAFGEPLDKARHQPAVEIKGATLTALKVARTGDGNWVAQCVVDV